MGRKVDETAPLISNDLMSVRRNEDRNDVDQRTDSDQMSTSYIFISIVVIVGIVSIMFGYTVAYWTLSTMHLVDSSSYILPSSGKGILAKDISSSKVRFVFVAGLEGSGHHAIHSIYSQCVSLGGPCAVNEEIMSYLYSGYSEPEGVFVYGGATNQSSSELRTLRKKFVTEITKEAASHANPTVIFLNAGEQLPRTGMMSYPNFGGDEKSLHHPDVRELALLCEEAGVDLRILVLQVCTNVIMI